jgi:hypothetical protein
MKTTFAAALAIFLLSSTIPCHAQLPPPGCTNCLELEAWYFPNTNWLSHIGGYPPIKFTNIVNVPGNYGNWLQLDTTNAIPAFLFYNVIETNSDSTTFTNMASAGSISLWFSPGWTSTNQGGMGPGNYANLISLGLAGTNGPWWGWYLSPDGCTVYCASQTNGGSPSVNLSAPVSFLTANSYNLVLIYGPTNSAFYTNGVLVTNGTGVEYWPGSNVTFFATGSDSNGYYQARGYLSDLETYNYQLDSNYVRSTFGMYSLFYGVAGSGESESAGLTNAQPAPPLAPAPHWFSGLGDLQNPTSAGFCTNTSSSNVVWLTNVFVTLQTNDTVWITFTIEGGLTNSYYDVFGCTSFASPATNTVWAWLGQGETCMTYTITNLPSSGAFLMLGTLIYAPDNDGLTLAFETLVSHTNPNSTNYDGLPNAWIALNGLQGTNGLPGLDPDQDGLNNMQEYLYGTKPLVPEGTAIWVANPAGYSGIP